MSRVAMLTFTTRTPRHEEERWKDKGVRGYRRTVGRHVRSRGSLRSSVRPSLHCSFRLPPGVLVSWWFTMAFVLAGCRGGPQPPPSDLRPDPGYQRISPAGLHFSVDVPEGWSV